MADVARLQMEVDSRPAKEATEALAGLAKQSELTTTAYGDLHDATSRSRDIVQEKLRAQREASQVTGELAEKQWSLTDALSVTDEAVNDVRLGMEMFRLEFEQGEISQDEYAQGLLSLKDRLQDLDVDTIGSVRTTRMLNKEITGLGGEARSTGTMVSGSTTALNSMGTIMGTLATGSGNLSTRLARVGQNLGIMTQYSGGASAALQSLTGFIMSPAGLIFAAGAAIPLIARLTESLREKNQALLDTERAGQTYTRTLDEMIDRITDFYHAEEEAFGTARLEDRLRRSEDLASSAERHLETLKEERDEISAAAGGMGLTVEMADRYGELQEEIAVTEDFIASQKERQKELSADIYANQLLQGDEVARQQKSEAERVDRLEELDKLWEKIVERSDRYNQTLNQTLREFSIEDEVLDEGTDDRRKQAEEDRERRRKEMYAERRSFEQSLQQMREENIMSGLSRIEQIERTHQQEVDAIRNNAALTDRQRTEALAELEIKRAREVTEAQKEQFDPRSLGGMRQAIADLEAEKERLWDPEEIAAYDNQIQALQSRIDELTQQSINPLHEAIASLDRPMSRFLEGASYELISLERQTERVRNEYGRWEERVVTLDERLGRLFRNLLEDISMTINRLLIIEPLMDSLFGAERRSGSLGGIIGSAIGAIGSSSGSPAASVMETAGWANNMLSVNDALIMKDGKIIEPHADDHILAFKDPAMLGGGKSDVNVSVNVVNQSSAQVDVQQRRMPNGDVQIQALVKDAVEGLMNGGRLDRAMSKNFGLTRQGVRRG